MSMKFKLQSIFPSTSQTFHRWMNRLENQLDSKVVPTDWDVVYLSCLANQIADVHHKSFAEFRGCYRNKPVIIMGTGPTVKYFDHETLENIPIIGVNGVYRLDGIHPDFLFFQDMQDEGENGSFSLTEIEKLDNCIKFAGSYIRHVKPESHLSLYQIERMRARQYYVADYYGIGQGYSYDHYLPQDIEYFPLVDNASTIFSAFQFALHTRASKIYLVGCDCSHLGTHFYEVNSTPIDDNWVLEGWKRMREHVSLFFSEVEVVSINPVGLKGLFTDQYTYSYLEYQSDGLKHS